MRGLRDCDPVTVDSANLDPDRFSIRITSRSGSQSTSRSGLNRSRLTRLIVHTVKMIRIAIRISLDPDRDPDVFGPCKRGISKILRLGYRTKKILEIYNSNRNIWGTSNRAQIFYFPYVHGGSLVQDLQDTKH